MNPCIKEWSCESGVGGGQVHWSSQYRILGRRELQRDHHGDLQKASLENPVKYSAVLPDEETARSPERTTQKDQRSQCPLCTQVLFPQASLEKLQIHGEAGGVHNDSLCPGVRKTKRHPKKWENTACCEGEN